MTTDQYTPERPALQVLHNPGPFHYGRDADGVDDLWVIYSQADGKDIAQIVFWDCEESWMARSEANARLLSAAPELVDALTLLMEAVSQLPASVLTTEVYAAELQSRQVIAKALGRRQP